MGHLSQDPHLETDAMKTLLASLDPSLLRGSHYSGLPAPSPQLSWTLPTLTGPGVSMQRPAGSDLSGTWPGAVPSPWCACVGVFE